MEYIKPEQLGSFLTNFAKTIVAMINTSSTHNQPLSQAGGVINGSHNQKCNFDGCNQFIRDCPAVEEYIRQGRCHRNIDGKVVLPSGAFVP
jgi:hypothetical protein